MADIFTTEALVRVDAGFENNINIDDTNDLKIFSDSANAEVLSSVASKYSLPLSNNSNYTDSPAENFLKQIATSLGAGMALCRQYEGQGGNISDIGVDKKKSARDSLKRLMNGTIRLIDSTGAELGTVNASLSSIQGFPNNSDNNPPKFSIDKRY